MQIPVHINSGVEAEFDLERTNTKIFRTLIGSILPDHRLWTNSNADKMLINHTLLLDACFGKKNTIIFRVSIVFYFLIY